MRNMKKQDDVNHHTVGKADFWFHLFFFFASECAIFNIWKGEHDVANMVFKVFCQGEEQAIIQ